MPSSSTGVRSAVSAGTFCLSLGLAVGAARTFTLPGLIGFSSEPLSGRADFWYSLGSGLLSLAAGVVGLHRAFQGKRPSVGGVIAFALGWLGLTAFAFAFWSSYVWLFAVLLAPGHATGAFGVVLCVREWLRERAFARFNQPNPEQR